MIIFSDAPLCDLFCLVEIDENFSDIDLASVWDIDAGTKIYPNLML
jgi:hypothetical protein